jgi:hypothetical protein
MDSVTPPFLPPELEQGIFELAVEPCPEMVPHLLLVL